MKLCMMRSKGSEEHTGQVSAAKQGCTLLSYRDVQVPVHAWKLQRHHGEFDRAHLLLLMQRVWEGWKHGQLWQKRCPESVSPWPAAVGCMVYPCPSQTLCVGAAPKQTDLPLLLFLIQGIWATFVSHFKISKCMNDSHVFWDSVNGNGRNT